MSSNICLVEISICLESEKKNRRSYLGHSAINHEFSGIDEAALVAGKKQDCLSLLNSLTKTSGREMDLTTMTLRCVITEPVLKKRSAETR